ncbi:MAG: hypothetical protein LBL59_08200 [Xanthomonadaceae bacterium]|jgi:hypothetical protein|nr:hypothetical protein [Xanthomonadaceae bacterium]
MTTNLDQSIADFGKRVLEVGIGLLLTSPTLQWHAGLSGLLHGWTAWLLVRRGGKVAAGGLVPLTLELAWEALPDTAIHTGIPVAIRAPARRGGRIPSGAGGFRLQPQRTSRTIVRCRLSQPRPRRFARHRLVAS